MLFNRQEGLGLSIPDEVIIHYLITDASALPANKIHSPCFKALLDLIDTLATVGVVNFNIMVANVGVKNETDNTIASLQAYIQDHFTTIRERRCIEYTLTTHRMFDTLREGLASANIPKFFIATNYLQLIRKEYLSSIINEYLAMPIDDNSYFLGTGYEPFLLRGQDGYGFIDFLSTIKEHFDTPLVALDFNRNREADDKPNKYWQLLDTYLGTFNRITDPLSKLRKHPTSFKTAINYALKHELLVSLTVNVCVKPDMYVPSQLFIIKKIFDSFFQIAVDELDMRPKSSKVIEDDMRDIFHHTVARQQPSINEGDSSEYTIPANN